MLDICIYFYSEVYEILDYSLYLYYGWKKVYIYNVFYIFFYYYWLRKLFV